MGRLIRFLVLAGLLWAAGLIVFIARLPDGAEAGAAKSARADGVVVYTGTGGARIKAGMSLLGDGAGQRLLISGVNPDISREELAKLWPGEPSAWECCVDLGRKAQTTQGNAIEVRDWAEEHGFASIILVTSDYHMPRALLETQAQLGEAEIISHPVQSGYLDAGGRPADVEALRQLAIEYTKFIAVRVKTWAPV